MRTKRLFALLGLVLSSVLSCKTTKVSQGRLNDAQVSADGIADMRTWRGNSWDFDAGPPADSKWTELFSQTPNYRGIGMAFLNGPGDKKEKFRWVYGPMYYRGRLTPNDVKVFVIGQEGAQDENASNRSFTGSTGTKMQNLLRTIGINHSYLFMNTFVYTINGQYDSKSDRIQKLAQNMETPIVVHRHQLFDYMYETNREELALVVGVGGAGKDTAVTWIRHMWMTKQGLSLADASEKCKSLDKPDDWEQCDVSVLGNVKAIGLPHPGGASPSNGGQAALEKIIAMFNNAVQKIQTWTTENPDWLVSDPDPKAPGNLMAKDFGAFKYGNTSVPHSDFPFGTAWRLGAWGTSSNRRGAAAIQLFSSDGRYNNQGHIIDDYAPPADIQTSIAEMQPIDLAWEPPRSAENRNSFDPGPGKFAQALMGGTANKKWPDFKSLGAISHNSFGYGMIYRGRLDQARVLILADQESHDDLFSSRALTGLGGQRLQAFLAAAGMTKSYGIIRTLPVDTLGVDAAQVMAMAQNSEVVAVRNEIFRQILAEGNTEIVLAVGDIAGQVIDSMDLQGSLVIKIASPKAENYTASWQAALERMKALAITPDVAATFVYNDKDRQDLPRIDMPFHMRWWMGTDGDRVVRNTSEGVPSGNYYTAHVPNWIAKMKAPALSSDETQIVNKIKEQPPVAGATTSVSEVLMDDTEGVPDMPDSSTPM